MTQDLEESFKKLQVDAATKDYICEPHLGEELQDFMSSSGISAIAAAHHVVAASQA